MSCVPTVASVIQCLPMRMASKYNAHVRMVENLRRYLHVEKRRSVLLSVGYSGSNCEIIGKIALTRKRISTFSLSPGRMT